MRMTGRVWQMGVRWAHSRAGDNANRGWTYSKRGGVDMWNAKRGDMLYNRNASKRGREDDLG
jgi:hypothetical protein